MSEQATPTIVTLEPMRAAIVRGQAVPMAQIRDFFDSSFQALGQAMLEQGATPTSAAFALYASRPTETADLSVGFGVSPDFEAAGPVTIIEVPGGRAGQLVHVGDFEQLGTSWERLVTWVQEQGESLEGWFFEEYLTEPKPGMDPADMLTRLNYPLAEHDANEQ